LLRIVIGLGDPDEADDLACGLSATSVRERCVLRSARSILEEARGEFESALSSYREAADAWSGFGDVVEEAFAHLGAGRCLLALRQAGEAVELRPARRTSAIRTWPSGEGP